MTFDEDAKQRHVFCSSTNLLGTGLPDGYVAQAGQNWDGSCADCATRYLGMPVTGVRRGTGKQAYIGEKGHSPQVITPTDALID